MRKGLSRKMSFAECTVEDALQASYALKAVSQGFHQNFWVRVLTGSFQKDAALLQHLTLRFWVHAFNVHARSRLAGGVKGMDMTGTELQQILRMSPRNTSFVVRLLNPMAPPPFSSAAQEIDAWLGKVRVSFLLVCVAGVVCSKAVSALQTVHFIFELFDFDGSEDLTSQEFGLAFRSLVNAFQRIFGLRDQDCISSEAIASWADEVYRNIAKEMQIKLGPRTGLGFETLSRWLFGSSHGLALPWRYALLRFSSDRYGAVADSFDESLNELRLDWKDPQDLESQQPCPVHGESRYDCSFLSRQEVVRALRMFNELQEDGVMNLAEARAHGGAALPRVPGEKLTTGVQEDNDFQRLLLEINLKNLPKRVDFREFLGAICPCATAKEQSLFAHWTQQHERYELIRANKELFTRVRDMHEQHSQKPVLPEEERNALVKAFRHADRDGDGLVGIDELVVAGLLTGDIASEVVQQHDVNGDLMLDSEEFVRLMCPDEYRHGMDSANDELEALFETWLVHHQDIAVRLESAEEAERLATTATMSQQMADMDLEVAPLEKIEVWRTLFRQLDIDGSGGVTVHELRKRSNAELADAVAKLMGGEDAIITEQEFLEAACLVQNYKRSSPSYYK